MPRHVIEDAGTSVLPNRYDADRFEQVIALIGIERAELAAEQPLVVADERDAAEDVVDEIKIAAPVHVPREPRIVDTRAWRADMWKS